MELVGGDSAESVDTEYKMVNGGMDNNYIGGHFKGNSSPLTSDMPKDNIITGLIPAGTSECAVWLQTTAVCSSDAAISMIGKSVGVGGSPTEVIAAAKEKLSCGTEKCVVERAGLPQQIVRGELALRFKQEGPLSPALLSNINIDGIMAQYSAAFPEFFAYNFHMRDYAKYSFRSGRVVASPDTLATIQFDQLYNRGIRCCGCVINSDIYAGPGKHWMSLFADARGPKWTVEFFNSSGNPPAAEWINWMEKTRGQMEAVMRDESSKNNTNNSSHEPKLVKVSTMRHQDSKSECGVYSLFYIWARLNNVPHEYFGNTRVYDQHMFEFRRQIFNDPQDTHRGPFVWKEYTARYETRWEK